MSEARVVYEFEKHASEIVRFAVGEYAGRPIFYARVFYRPPDGEPLPTKKGITMSVEGFLEFEKGVAKVRAALEKTGALKKKGGSKR